MAYTTPDRTWVPGEVATAAFFNTYLRDNMKWLSTDKPMARAYNTPTQSVAASSTATLLYNTNRFDNAFMHNTSSNTNRMTIPASSGGKYLIGTYTLMPGQATVGNYQVSTIRQSGVTVIAANQVQVVNSASFGPGMTVTTMWSAAAADWFDSSYFQDGAAALSFTSQEFWAIWVGI